MNHLNFNIPSLQYLEKTASSFINAATPYAGKVSKYILSLEKPPFVPDEVLTEFHEESKKALNLFWNNPDIYSLGNYVLTSFYLKKTLEDVLNTSTILTSVLAKSALKNVAQAFFQIIPLPVSIPPQKSSLNADALMYIGSAITLTTLASSSMKDKRYQKWFSSISMSITTGTAISWIFEQNPYVGAASGALVGFLTPWTLFSRSFERVSKKLSNVCPLQKVNDFFYRYRALLPIATFGGVLYQITEKFPNIAPKPALAISGGAALAVYYIFIKYRKSVKNVTSRICSNIGPIIWSGYLSALLSTAAQNTLTHMQTVNISPAP